MYVDIIGLKLIRETISVRHLMPRPLRKIDFMFVTANKISFDPALSLHIQQHLYSDKTRLTKTNV